MEIWVKIFEVDGCQVLLEKGTNDDDEPCVIFRSKYPTSGIFGIPELSFSFKKHNDNCELLRDEFFCNADESAARAALKEFQKLSPCSQ